MRKAVRPRLGGIRVGPILSKLVRDLHRHIEAQPHLEAMRQIERGSLPTELVVAVTKDHDFAHLLRGNPASQLR